MYGSIWPLTCFISIAGIIGNILSIVVWNALKNNIMKYDHGCHVYFVLLPAVDTVILVLHLITENLVVAVPDIQHVKNYAYFYCYVGHPLYFFAIYASGFLVVSLTIQRAQIVLSPMKTLTKNMTLQSQILVAFAFSVSFFINITSFFAFKPKIIQNMIQISNLTTYNTTSKRVISIVKNDLEKKDIMFTIRCVFATGVPCILILLGNIAIYKSQKNGEKQYSVPRFGIKQKQNLTQSNSVKSINQTLIVITCTTFLFWSLRCVNGCMQYIMPTENVLDNHYVGFQNLAVTLGASINLLIYFLPGKVFRDKLKQLLFRQPDTNQFLDVIGNSQFLQHRSKKNSEATDIQPPGNLMFINSKSLDEKNHFSVTSGVL